MATLPRLLIASDHAGFDFKERVKRAFPKIDWVDLGPHDSARVDYPDYADRVAKKVATGEVDRGILICGSGQGMAMRANRYKGVRAAVVWNEESAKLSRQHNDANVLSLGARLIPFETAQKLIETFLNTKFEGGRHADRVKKFDKSSEC